MLGRCFREFALNLGTAISIMMRVFRVVFNWWLTRHDWVFALSEMVCISCRKLDAMMLIFCLLERDCVFSNLTVNQSNTIAFPETSHPMCEEFGRNGYCCGTHYSPRRGDWSLGLSKCPATEGSPNWFDSSRIERKKERLPGAMQTAFEKEHGVAPFFWLRWLPANSEATEPPLVQWRCAWGDFQNEVFRSRYWGLCCPDSHLPVCICQAIRMQFGSAVCLFTVYRCMFFVVIGTLTNLPSLSHTVS